MATRYLNVDLKDAIQSKINKEVTQSMDASTPGKELASIKSQIIKRLTQLVLKDCPAKDLAILEKYELVTTHDQVSMMVTEEGDILEPWYHERAKALVVGLPSITSRKIGNENLFLVELIAADEKLTALCATAAKIHHLIQCELKETVDAYMTRVDQFRTVKKLLENYPTMRKFIPKKEAPKQPVEPSRADKLIAQFEGMEA
ncbi:MAG: hypothetical protein MI749_14180 [Desulfovibrionales bacterium]|nr:hypothetical protein [Desulfovibrionales bacterium]